MVQSPIERCDISFSQNEGQNNYLKNALKKWWNSGEAGEAALLVARNIIR